MKRNIFIPIFLIIILFLKTDINSQSQYWHNIQVNFVLPVTGIYFYDSLKGWYVTNGMNANLGITRDGGANWFYSVIDSSIYDLKSIYFINENTGWTVGSFFVIRKTTNGGYTWVNQDNMLEMDYRTVHFSNLNTGFIGGRDGIIIKTTNGGTNWNIAYLSSVQYSEVVCQHWLNHDTGWLAGTNILVKTTDCGATFENFYGYFPPSSNGYNGFLDIYFVNENTGWVSGINIDQKNLFKTTNGGYNWEYQENPVQHEGYTRQINGIKFINENTGWGASSALMMIKTTNGGTNWTIDLTNNTFDGFFCVEKNLKNRVWTGSDMGRLWYRDSLYIVNINNISSTIIRNFKLYQNYPNPFNPITRICFDIPKEFDTKISGDSKITLKVFNILGKEVAILVNEKLRTGAYEVIFDGGNLSGGVYFYRLQTDSYNETRKMILMK